MKATDSQPQLAIPLALSPLIEENLAHLDSHQQALVREFAERGYVIIDTGLPNFEDLADEVIDGLDGNYPSDEKRIAEAWYTNSAVRELSCAPAVMNALRTLYGREPIPFQTLNFESGSEQAAHVDTIHFHCIPRFYMAGAWFALEDVDEENGALFVYPGSHRMREFDMTSLGLEPIDSNYPEYERRLQGVLDASGLKRETIRVRKGQVILWAANLVHGGLPIKSEGTTRHSQATHYYFENGVYYFPMGSEPIAGKVVLREVINLATGEFVPPKHNGHEVQLECSRGVMAYPRPLPDWVQEPLEAGPARKSTYRSSLADHNHELQTSVAHLQAVVDASEVRLAKMDAENRAKDRFLRKSNSMLAYKVMRRVTQSLSGVLWPAPRSERRTQPRSRDQALTPEKERT